MSSRTLEGRTIVITRATEDCEGLSSELTARGAQVISVPSVHFQLSDDLRAWEQAIAIRRDVNSLLFTSPRSVRFFSMLCREQQLKPASWDPCLVAAIGERTRHVLESVGWRVDFVPEKSTGLDFAAELLRDHGLGPGHVALIPQSGIARPDVAEQLEIAGATVLSVPVYDTLPEEPSHAEEILRRLRNEEVIDAILFASPSALRGFLSITGEPGRTLLAGPARIVAIGPTTGRAIRDANFEVAAEGNSGGAKGLLAALESIF